MGKGEGGRVAEGEKEMGKGQKGEERRSGMGVFRSLWFRRRGKMLPSWWKAYLGCAFCTTPALFTTMSSLPYFASAASSASCQVLTLETSPDTVVTLPDGYELATWLASSALMSTTTTLAPSVVYFFVIACRG
jgi:hypothetical protein